MTAEGIHVLRLEIKTLRTALDLAEFITRRKAWTKPLRRMLSPVFNRAGEVRTAQMNLQLLRREASRPVTGYEKALLGEEAWSGEVLRSLMVNFDVERFRRLAAAAATVIGELENIRVNFGASHFIRLRYDIASTTLKNVRTARELHEVRKNIKSARNAVRLASLLGIRRRSGIEERIVRTADQSLGAWHDEIVFRNHIRKFIRTNPAAPDARELGTIEARLRKDRPARFERVVGDTRKRVAVLRPALRDGWISGQPPGRGSRPR